MRSASDKTAGTRATQEKLERLARGQQALRRDLAAAAITSAQAREELIPAQGEPVQRPAAAGAGVPQGIELRSGAWKRSWARRYCSAGAKG